MGTGLGDDDESCGWNGRESPCNAPGRAIFLSYGNAHMQYKAFPGRGGFESAPDFRKSHWMPLAQNILNRMMPDSVTGWFRCGFPKGGDGMGVEAKG